MHVATIQRHGHMAYDSFCPECEKAGAIAGQLCTFCQDEYDRKTAEDDALERAAELFAVRMDPELART